MIQYSLKDILPRFLMNDQNGYAMAKAMETAMNYFLVKCQEGLDALNDVDKMPEWRLDEMAWEYNLVYDYNANIDFKRNWVRNAWTFFSKHGTPEGIRQYLASYFDVAEIIEWFDSVDMEPCYFDVKVAGVWNGENTDWVRTATEKVKNVRSILRNVIYSGGESSTTILAGAEKCGTEIVQRAISLD